MSSVGKTGYEAYRTYTKGKTFDGREMPTWERLTDAIREAWAAAGAAERVAEHAITREGPCEPTIRSQVLEFHRAMGQPVLPSPQVPDEKRIKLRAKLIAEEMFEALEAMYSDEHAKLTLGVAKRAISNLIEHETPVVNLVELADALADTDYVVEGTRLEFGILGKPIADEVHRTNMLKTTGPVDKDGKRLKPLDWQPPRIEELGLPGMGGGLAGNVDGPRAHAERAIANLSDGDAISMKNTYGELLRLLAREVRPGEGAVDTLKRLIETIEDEFG
jgi:predicted HAD superfamily Cof-like phosphohydrolase